MIDWLRRDPAEKPPVRSIILNGRALPLAIIRHPTAKRLTLRLAPDGEGVKVTIPRWGRVGDALDFARSRTDWLEAELAKRPLRAPPVPGGIIHYRGSELAIEWSPKAPRQPNADDSQIYLGGPEASIEARLKRWLRDRAMELFEADAAEYSAMIDLPPPPLSLSTARRRWGSCASDGTMRLNWRLVQAPDHVRRSVVAHETAHRVHFDHSPAFHALLAELFGPELPAADRWLKDHGPGLFSTFG